MKKTNMRNNRAGGIQLRNLRDNDEGVLISTLIMAIIVLFAFVFFVMNIVQIAMGLAVIGISFILIGAGINVIRNSLTRKKYGDPFSHLRH